MSKGELPRSWDRLLARKFGDGADRGNVNVVPLKYGEWRIEVSDLYCTVVAVQVHGWTRAVRAVAAALRALPNWEGSFTGTCEDGTIYTNDPCEECEGGDYHGNECGVCWHCDRWLCGRCRDSHPDPEECHR